MGQIQGEAKHQSPPGKQLRFSDFQASANTCTARAAWEMLFLMFWMFCQLYLLLLLLSQPQHAPCSGRCRNMGSITRWATPRSSPMSAICQRFLLCHLTHCKATSSKGAQLASLRPCIPFLLFSTQKKKKGLTWRKASIYLIKRQKKKAIQSYPKGSGSLNPLFLI